MSNKVDVFANALAEKPLLVTHRRSRECLSLVKGEKISLANVSEIIALEPGLCMLVLRYVNRIRAKSNNRFEINSLPNACNLMGEIALKKMLASAPVLESKVTDDAIKSDYFSLVDRSIHAAHYAHSWAEFRRDASPHEVRVAALLRDIGEMALCIHHHDKYREIKHISREHAISISGAATKVLGFSLLQLSEELAKNWFLPDVVRDGTRLEMWHLYRPQGVMLASELASQVEYGWYHNDMFLCKELLAQYLNVDVAKACDKLHRSTVRLAREGILHDDATFAAKLVQLPAEKTKGVEKSECPTTSNKAAKPAEQKLASTPIPKKPKTSQIYAQCAQQIKMRAASGGSNSSDLLKLMLHGLHKGLDLQRVAFAMKDKDGNSLRIRLAKGLDSSAAEKIIFPCFGNSLFTSLLKGPKSIWINSDNLDKFKPMIPGSLIQQTKAQSFIAVSVFSGDKPVGIIYADCLGGKTPLDAGIYQQAKSLILFTGKAITLVEAARRVAQQKRKNPNGKSAAGLIKSTQNTAGVVKHSSSVTRPSAAQSVKAVANQVPRRG